MYDQNLALSCAHAAKLAYADNSDHPRDVFISAGSTQATVVKRGNLVILAFRGTEPDKINDWLSDLHVAKVPFHGQRVHAGFNAAYQKISNRIFQQIDTLDESDQLHITGHSLGAALATLAACDLGQQGIKINSIYTFGSPRVGNRKFASAYNLRFEGRAYRIINDSDIVCRVPSMLRWRHVDQPIFFRKNKPAEMIAPPWWYGLSEVLQNIIHLRPAGSFTDHSIDKYIDVLTHTYGDKK